MYSTKINFVDGEAVRLEGVRSLSALYRPSYKKYPTFPSIYETKYQHDYRYVPFALSPNYK